MRVCSCLPEAVFVGCQILAHLCGLIGTNLRRSRFARFARLTNLSCELTGTVRIVKLVTGSCLPAPHIRRLAVSIL